MIIYDYSNYFSVEKKFRGIRDIRTPEVSYRTAGWGLGALITLSVLYWVSLRHIVELLPLPGWVKIVLPVIVIGGASIYVARAATNRLKHDKELLHLVTSWGRFRVRPHLHVNLSPFRARRHAVATEYVHRR